MGKSINKFIVKMSDPSNFKPKLTVTVSEVKDKANTYLIKLIHPNYTLTENKKRVYEIVHSEEYVSELPVMEAISAAMKKGYEILETPLIQQIAMSTKYVEQIFIPQGKRGKVKLKTKDSAEAIAEREVEAMAIAGDDPELEEDLPEVDTELMESGDDAPEAVEEFSDEEDEAPAPKAKKVESKKSKNKEVKVKATKALAKAPKNKKAKKKVSKVEVKAKKPAKLNKKVVAKNKKKKK